MYLCAVIIKTAQIIKIEIMDELLEMRIRFLETTFETLPRHF